MTPSLHERVAAAAVGAIAVATFSTSAVTLTALARDSGGTAPALAPMLPVALDGMVIAASLAVVTARRAGRSATSSWALVAVYTALSVAGNALHAAANGAVAAVIAAAFPLTLLASFEQLLRITAHHAAATPHPERNNHTDDSARARVTRLWAAHTAAGGDPAALTGRDVARQAHCSVRRAQELLAELRTAHLNGEVRH